MGAEVILKVALDRGYKRCPLRSALYFCSVANKDGEDIMCGYGRCAPEDCPLRKGDVVVKGEK